MYRCLALCLYLTAAVDASAQSDLPEGAIVEASLVAEKKSASPGESLTLGLNLEILDHWHVYWRNAGDAGAPPELIWTLPDGITAGPFDWPVPSRMPEGPFMTFGYEQSVLLPFEVNISADIPKGQTLSLRAKARWLVCKDICIPEEQEVEISLPLSDEPEKPDPIWSARLAAAKEALPRQSPWPVTFQSDDKTLKLRFVGLGESVVGSSQMSFFPYEENVISNPAAQMVRQGEQGLNLSVPLQKGAVVPNQISGILVLESLSPSGAKTLAYEFVSKEVSAAKWVSSPSRTWGIVTLVLSMLGVLAIFLLGRRST